MEIRGKKLKYSSVEILSQEIVWSLLLKYLSSRLLWDTLHACMNNVWSVLKYLHECLHSGNPFWLLLLKMRMILWHLSFIIYAHHFK